MNEVACGVKKAFQSIRQPQRWRATSTTQKKGRRTATFGGCRPAAFRSRIATSDIGFVLRGFLLQFLAMAVRAVCVIEHASADMKSGCERAHARAVLSLRFFGARSGSTLGCGQTCFWV